MGRKKTLISEAVEKERARISQEIINCDDKIVKCYIAHDFETLINLQRDKKILEFLLSDLEPEKL